MVRVRVTAQACGYGSAFGGDEDRDYPTARWPCAKGLRPSHCCIDFASASVAR